MWVNAIRSYHQSDKVGLLLILQFYRIYVTTGCRCFSLKIALEMMCPGLQADQRREMGNLIARVPEELQNI